MLTAGLHTSEVAAKCKPQWLPVPIQRPSFGHQSEIYAAAEAWDNIAMTTMRPLGNMISRLKSVGNNHSPTASARPADKLSRRDFITTTAGAVACVGASGSVAGADKPFTPRFAICNEVFEGWPFDKAFAFAAEAGYQGIEFAPFTAANDVRTISAAKRKEIRAQAARSGLEIFGLHWLLAKTEGFHLTSADPQVRRRTADYLVALTHFCADLGGDLLIFGSPQQRSLAPGMTRAEGLAHAAEVIHAAMPALAERKVTIALEPLSPKSTNFLTTAAEGVELMNQVNSPRCRLNLDCLAMSSEPTPIPELIRRHRDQLAHFQVNDPNRQGPGFGELDFVPILAALREINYAGWISVEAFDFSPGPERLARESIAYMKRCLR